MTKNDSNDFEIIYTKPLIRNSSDEYRADLEAKFRESISFFPELNPKAVKFGLRTTCVASAQTYRFEDNQDFMSFGVNPTEVTRYYTMGHELMHFEQAISDIPSGEKQCDVWTMAKNEIFVDKAPRYIDIPTIIRKYWGLYKYDVRRLSIEAIERRKKERRYIQWMETEIMYLECQNVLD